MSEKPHKHLKVWQESVVLARLTYLATQQYPSAEKYGLVSQMRRSAVSVASNIAEGAARFNTKEKIQFFTIARGSLSELDTQFEISKQLNMISSNCSIPNKMDEIGLMLNGLINSCRRKL